MTQICNSVTFSELSVIIKLRKWSRSVCGGCKKSKQNITPFDIEINIKKNVTTKDSYRYTMMSIDTKDI